MIEIHLRKLRARDEISAEEERAIADTIERIVEVPANKTIVRAGEPLDHSTLLLDGWMARASDLRNGQRQITELHVPGDYTDIHGFTLKRLDHDVISLTACKLGLAPHPRIRELTEKYPHVGRVYWLGTTIDAAIHREWVLSVSRRSALERAAHLFCELHVRLGLVGLTDGDSYAFPMTQSELGECLGLTTVHVNRTLQELRRLELIRLEGRRLDLLDLAALRTLAEFDDAYLFLEKRSRAER